MLIIHLMDKVSSEYFLRDYTLREYLHLVHWTLGMRHLQILTVIHYGI